MIIKEIATKQGVVFSTWDRCIEEKEYDEETLATREFYSAKSITYIGCNEHGLRGFEIDTGLRGYGIFVPFENVALMDYKKGE